MVLPFARFIHGQSFPFLVSVNFASRPEVFVGIVVKYDKSRSRSEICRNQEWKTLTVNKTSASDVL